MLGTKDFEVLSAEELEKVSGGGMIYLAYEEHQNIPPYIMESYSPRVQNAIRDAISYGIMPY